jgi:hypothetical protein
MSNFEHLDDLPIIRTVGEGFAEIGIQSPWHNSGPDKSGTITIQQAGAAVQAAVLSDSCRNVT